MRVLLLGFGKIAYMPYMNFYLDTLQTIDDVETDLIYWDRDGKPDAAIPSQINRTFKFEAHLEEQLPFKKKLKYFAKYRYFALKILKNNEYNRIIVLHTTPGMTLIDYLCRHYNGRFILDFRDISHETNSVYRTLVGKLVNASAVTYVSSNAFRKYLPEIEKIYTIHNYLEDSLKHQNLRQEKNGTSDRIRISYWGLVRQVEVNKKFMDALGNDARFELHYYGRMQQDGREMEAYAKAKAYSNIYFHGQYMPEERYEFAARTDMIHNVYDLDNTMKNAMPNKYYDGIIFSIPQISTKGSHMGDIITNRGVGTVIDLDSQSIADDLWNYYKGIDWIQFEKKCSVALQTVLSEQNIAKEKLLELF